MKEKRLKSKTVKAFVKFLKTTDVSFPSLSALFLHLEAYPKTLDELDKRANYFLKPVLLSWQLSKRPKVSWSRASDFIVLLGL